MKNYVIRLKLQEGVTEEDFQNFLQAKTNGERMNLLIAHSQKNRQAKNIKEQTECQINELNAQFIEFLHTKGIGAKFRLVVKNIKEGAKNARQNTAAQIAKAKANAAANIPHCNKSASPVSDAARELAEQFETFLKENELDTKYSVEITEEE